jgi:Flp pilus assembly protein TadD
MGRPEIWAGAAMGGPVVRRMAVLALMVALTGCGSGALDLGDLGAGSGAGGAAAGGNPALTGASARDPVSLGKRQFADGNYGLAEEQFRKAVEIGPRDAEAWLGLAASYDRLKRFDLADRAYGQAIRILGRTATVLNNQGYSYMLRGDLKRARALLDEARRKDPDNPHVLANLDLLAESVTLAKDIR